MALYFRSDDRPPEVIFKTGFSRRSENELKLAGLFHGEWWRNGVKEYAANRYGLNNTAIDAAPEAVVCLSTKMESAAIFPMSEKKEVYVYAISLPDAVQLEYEERPIYFTTKALDIATLKQHENSYFFVYNEKSERLQLFYVGSNLELTSLKLSQPEHLLSKFKTISTDLEHPHTLLDEQLPDTTMEQLRGIIIRANPKHESHNLKLMAERIETVENKSDDRDIFLMDKIPGNLDKYKNNYIFIIDENKNNVNAFYIRPNGEIEKLQYAGTDQDKQFIAKIYKETNEIYDGSHSLSSDHKNQLWKIIPYNEGHPPKGFSLSTKLMVPTDNQKAVIDLHSLQTTQVSNFVQSLLPPSDADTDDDIEILDDVKLSKEEKISKITSRAAWPLAAYEAFAYQVPPENIISAVKVIRTQKGETEVESFSDYHKEAIKFPLFSCKKMGDTQVNENFIKHQTLQYGEGTNAREVDLQCERDYKAAKTLFEEMEPFETPDISHGLGGKTFS